MSRNRASAKRAGTRFERQVADHLATYLDDRIDRRVKTGVADKGDIGGVRLPDGRCVVIECKNTTRLALAQWVKEAHQEAHNDNAAVGLIVHKRHGVSHPGDQWITMTLDDLITILKGRP